MAQPLRQYEEDELLQKVEVNQNTLEQDETKMMLSRLSKKKAKNYQLKTINKNLIIITL